MGMTLEQIAENHGLTPDGVDYALNQYQIVISEITHGLLSKLTYDAHDVLQIAQERWCDTCELKEAQEPRVMALSDVCSLKESTPVWLEDIDKKDVICALFIKDFGDTKCVGFSVPYKWYFKRITADYIDYGIRWRCWTSRPNEKVRAETPWE